MNQKNDSTKRIETKDDIKEIIDTSTNYNELYRNSIDVLQKMESTFKDTLKNFFSGGKKYTIEDLFNGDEAALKDLKKIREIKSSIFDDILDTRNPVTIFEKKWSELIKKSQDIVDESEVINAWVQLAESVVNQWLNQEWKNKMVDELFDTRMEAILDFQKDIEDGIISNTNNIDIEHMELNALTLWWDLFELHFDKVSFDKIIDGMSLPMLIFWTFNIENGSWAFEDCLTKVKEKLWNQNLFDYIDSLEETWNQTSEMLKYSSLKMLLKKRKISDLINRIKWYNWNQQELLQYIEDKSLKDTSFKTWFLSSIKILEKLPDFDWFFSELTMKVKEDPIVQQAYENASRVDNADVFKSWVVTALVIYDDDNWWGGTYFLSDLQLYKNKWFSLMEKVTNNPNYEKYVLKKGRDAVTLVKLIKSAGRPDDELKQNLSEIIKGVDYNLFSLRWHCNSTYRMAVSLWWLNVVQENDIFIDGWCSNASHTWEYYAKWIKWQVFAYTWVWKWAYTQSFVNKIFENKSNTEGFKKILNYYNNSYGYFANHTERPDSVATQYKRLLAYENADWDIDGSNEESTTQENWDVVMGNPNPQDDL